MNSAISIGLAALDLKRKHPNFEPQNKDAIRALSATGWRFFDFALEVPDSVDDDTKRSFLCKDEVSFLERIEASEAQIAALEGSTLRLDVGYYPNGDFSTRWCALVAVWQGEREGMLEAEEEIVLFDVINPTSSRAALGCLAISDAYQVDSEQGVFAHSPEHRDIEAIADFFLPDPEF